MTDWTGFSKWALDPAYIRNIPGYDTDYFVDIYGVIYSAKRGLLKKRKVGDDHRGYLIASLKRLDGKVYPLKVHHAVLYAFVGPRPSARHLCLHADDNGHNNCLTNLSWGTTQDNQKDKTNNQAPANRHKRKINLKKRVLIKRMVAKGFTAEEISVLTCWSLKKVEKELAK